MKPKIEFYNSADNLIYTVNYNSHSEYNNSLSNIQTLMREVSLNLLDDVPYVITSEGSLINAQ